MVALPEVKNVADLPDTGGNSVLIPQGQYQALIVNSEMKSTKDNAGQFLALTVVITQGAHANTEFTERLNLVNKNPVAVDIAYKTLARISEAFGMDKTPADSSELHNKPLMIEVVTKKGKDWVNNKGETVAGNDQSEIKKYLPLPASGVPAGAATEVVAPTQEPQQAQAAAPATNPFAS